MNMCFSVYTGCNRVLSHSIPGRSLTNFGPVAAAEKILEVPDFIKSTSAKLYTPPFVLAPPVSAAPMEPTDPSVILLCAYCLSEDQRWLLATCTDSCGELLETCCISIDVPNRSQRKKAKVRKHALMKLWDFILGVMSGTTVSWRLVIGRFGRLGHGELLSKFDPVKWIIDWFVWIVCLVITSNIQDSVPRIDVELMWGYQFIWASFIMKIRLFGGAF